MLNVRGASRATLLALLSLGVAACARQPPASAPAPAAEAARDAQFGWARAALERNPDVEVLAADPRGIFTVRLRHDGGLRTFRLEDLVAAPPGGDAAQAGPSAPVPDEAAPVDSAPAAAASAAPAGAPTAGLTVTRDAGRVNITGPGVSIATAGAAPAASGASVPSRGEPPRASIERRGGQPIVCQGERLMRIDGRSIDFDADGLIVEDGCDLYLTNSRISAGRNAITVTNGKVHVVNSTVRGGHSSIDASLGSQVFLSGASIDGLQRRFDTAQINDLGGNRYR